MRRNTLKKKKYKQEICGTKRNKGKMEEILHIKRYYPIPQSSKPGHTWIDLPEMADSSSYFLKTRILVKL
jgi:hypothetical protein